MAIFPCALSAQDAAEVRLTRELCTCITEDEPTDLRLRARDCLLEVGERLEGLLLARYGRTLTGRDDREALSDSLAVLLSRDCPELSDMLAVVPGERSWSDRPSAAPLRYQFPPLGAPAGAGDGGAEQGGGGRTPAPVSESKIRRQLEGTLEDLFPDGRLRLQTPDQLWTLYLPARVRAPHIWVRGQTYTLRCLQTLSPEGDRLVWTVTGLVK